MLIGPETEHGSDLESSSNKVLNVSIKGFLYGRVCELRAAAVEGSSASPLPRRGRAAWQWLGACAGAALYWLLLSRGVQRRVQFEAAPLLGTHTQAPTHTQAHTQRDRT